jgi:hypothetical protein
MTINAIGRQSAGAVLAVPQEAQARQPKTALRTVANRVGSIFRKLGIDSR